MRIIITLIPQFKTNRERRNLQPKTAQNPSQNLPRIRPVKRTSVRDVIEWAPCVQHLACNTLREREPTYFSVKHGRVGPRFIC